MDHQASAGIKTFVVITDRHHNVSTVCCFQDLCCYLHAHDYGRSTCSPSGMDKYCAPVTVLQPRLALVKPQMVLESMCSITVTVTIC